MMIRRLDNGDHDLLRHAYSWDVDAPSWYKSMDGVFGPKTVDEFVPLVDDPKNAFIGIFNPELVGLITVSLVIKGGFEIHLWAKRGTSLDVLEEAGYQIREQLVDFGAKEIFVWVAEKNRPVKQLCARLGLLSDGIQMLKGSYKKRLIVWERLTYNPAQVEAQMAA